MDAKNLILLDVGEEEMKGNKQRYKWVVALLLALMIEIFVCNFNAIKVFALPDEKKNKEIKMSVMEEEKRQILVLDVQDKIDNIHLKLNESCDSYYTFELDSYSVYSPNQDKIHEGQKTTIGKKGNHQITMKINHPYEITTLYVSLTKTEEKELKKIEDIVIAAYQNVNSFEFHWIRLLFVFLGIVGFFYRKSEKIHQVVLVNQMSNNRFWIVSFLVAIGVALYTCSDCIVMPEYAILEQETIMDKRASPIVAYSVFRQTESFLQGRLSIDADTSELETLENPYDISQRQVNGTYYLFDIAYYNQKYYQYYTILINLWILPFRLLTGNYFDMSIYAASVLFVMILVSSIFYQKIVEKYIKRCSPFHYYLGYTAFLVVTGIFAHSRGTVYDMQICFGEIFFLLSLNLLMKLEQTTKKEYVWYFLLGGTTALIVLSKANMIVLYIPIVYEFWKLMKKKNYDPKEIGKRIGVTSILLIILAIFQMGYNYARFDSILEFGPKYQLTVSDMRYGINLSLNRLGYGVMMALFSMPSVSPFTFPFIREGDVYYDIAGFNEQMFRHYTIGLLAIPLLYGIFLKGNRKQIEENKELFSFIRVLKVTSVLFLLVTIIFAGVANHYLTDIRMLLTICSILLFLKKLEMVEKEDKKKYVILHTCFLLVSVLSIVMMFLVTMTFEDAPMKLVVQCYLKNGVMFWT